MSDHMHVVATRIKNIIHRTIDVKTPLAQVVNKNEMKSIQQSIWDEYQVHIETIDSIKDIAYILQKKINP